MPRPTPTSSSRPPAASSRSRSRPRRPRSSRDAVRGHARLGAQGHRRPGRAAAAGRSDADRRAQRLAGRHPQSRQAARVRVPARAARHRAVVAAAALGCPSPRRPATASTPTPGSRRGPPATPPACRRWPTTAASRSTASTARRASIPRAGPGPSRDFDLAIDKVLDGLAPASAASPPPTRRPRSSPCSASPCPTARTGSSKAGSTGPWSTGRAVPAASATTRSSCPTAQTRTFAEMTAAEKHAISHRRRALDAFLAASPRPDDDLARRASSPHIAAPWGRSSVGERLLCKQDVGGSIPPGSTNCFQRYLPLSPSSLVATVGGPVGVPSGAVGASRKQGSSRNFAGVMPVQRRNAWWKVLTSL